MNFRPLAVLALFTAVCTVSIPPSALAQEQDQETKKSEDTELTVQEKKELKSLIESARKAYQSEDYETSVEKLRAAYEIYPNPAFFYRIGLAEQNAGDYEAAVESFERYLEEKPDSDKKEALEKRLAKLRNKLEERSEQSEQKKEGAAETETSDEQTTEDGKRTADSSDNQTSSEPPEPPSPEDRAKKGGDRTFAYVLGGVGGAGIVTAGTFTYLFFQARKDLENLRSSSRRTPQTESREEKLITKRNRRLTITYASAGIAAAALGTAAYLLLRPGEKSESAGVSRNAPPSLGVALPADEDGIVLRLRGRF